MKTLLQIATEYVEAGYSVVPIVTDGSKRPAVKWEKYQAEVATEANLRLWFYRNRYGMAIVHGVVSGSSEVLDFDTIEAYTCWQDWVGHLSVDCPIVATPSGGRHVYYRTVLPPPGNQKLARDEDGKTIIETRGEGGYSLAPGSPLACHSTGKPYELLSGSFADVPVIDEETREFWLSCARSCNLYHRLPIVADGHSVDRVGSRPGDDYDRRHDWRDMLALLVSQGWQECGRRGDTVDLTRPGKSQREGFSATLNHVAPNVLYVFSTNALPFEANCAYTAYQVYTLLLHGGDFEASARELGRQGYGEAARNPRGNTSVELDWGGPLKVISPLMSKLGQWGEIEMAKRFVFCHGQNLRYDHTQKCWYLWTGTHWQPDLLGTAVQLVKQMITELYQSAALLDGEDRVKAIKAVSSYDRASKINNILALASTEESISTTISAWDTEAYLLNCENGTLDLCTGVLSSHRREDNLTICLATPYLPDARAPLWEAFLARVQPDVGIRAYLKRMVGYSLTADVGLQNLLFLWGSGGNGKSTFIETMIALLGEYSRKASSELLTLRRNEAIREDIAALAGKRFVATVEIDEGKAFAEALMKQLTGGDTITARRLYQNSFTFSPTWKIWLAANHKLEVRSGGKSVWRRIRLIPWTVTIPDDERDPDLPAKLMGEAAGILAWAVAGYLDLRQNGEQVPDAVRVGTEEYRTETDTIGQFIGECCETGNSCRTRPSTLYEAYRAWVEKRGERAKTLSAFGRTIQERGFEKITVDGNFWYRGVQLGPEPVEELELNWG
jgi:putative DNA primase/helicase